MIAPNQPIFNNAYPINPRCGLLMYQNGYLKQGVSTSIDGAMNIIYPNFDLYGPIPGDQSVPAYINNLYPIGTIVEAYDNAATEYVYGTIVNYTDDGAFYVDGFGVGILNNGDAINLRAPIVRPGIAIYINHVEYGGSDITVISTTGNAIKIDTTQSLVIPFAVAGFDDWYQSTGIFALY